MPYVPRPAGGPESRLFLKHKLKELIVLLKKKICVECNAGDCNYSVIDFDNPNAVSIYCDKLKEELFVCDEHLWEIVRVSPIAKGYGRCESCSSWDDAPIVFTKNKVDGEFICNECEKMATEWLEEEARKSGFNFKKEAKYAVLFQSYSLDNRMCTFAELNEKNALGDIAEDEWADGYGPGFRIREVTGAELISLYATWDHTLRCHRNY